MQLTPRYGTDPIIRIEGLESDPLALMVRQRARLAGTLATLDHEQWAAPSRCEGWTTQDVVTHLVTTNTFWMASISAGLAGMPTTFLATFDPVASPAQLVTAAGAMPASETLAGFEATNEKLATIAATVGEATWTALAEAPPGHVSIGCVALHALWDSLVHERDILTPLGHAVVEDPEELTAALIYAASLGPAFIADSGSPRTGAIELQTTEPELDWCVELSGSVLAHPGPAAGDAVRLTGDTAATLEALSRRAPLTDHITESDAWLFEGLATAFEQDV